MADSDDGVSQRRDNKVSDLNSIWSGTSMQTKLEGSRLIGSHPSF